MYKLKDVGIALHMEIGQKSRLIVPKKSSILSQGISFHKLTEQHQH